MTKSCVSPDDTLKILFSEDGGLYDLANISKLDPFDFYHGADLRGVDLSGQDLRGLNFDKADLRSANLENINFDAGAFNKSILHESAKVLIDPYDFSMFEILSICRRRPFAYYFFEFRPETLDALIASTPFYLSEIATRSEISKDTFRKARRGATIAQSTAKGVITALIDMHGADVRSRSSAGFRQPSMRLLEAKSSGLVQMSAEIFRLRFFSPELDLDNLGGARQGELQL